MAEGDVKSVYIIRQSGPDGAPFVYCICESNTTAARILPQAGAGADIVKFSAILHSGFWCAPFRIIASTTEDKLLDAQQAAYDAAMAKALAAGLTLGDLQALGAGDRP
jgi:hypothetical protein